MFASTRIRLVFSSSSFKLAAVRSVHTVRRKKSITPIETRREEIISNEDILNGIKVPNPRTPILSSLKESVDKILGESVALNDTNITKAEMENVEQEKINPSEEYLKETSYNEDNKMKDSLKFESRENFKEHETKEEDISLKQTDNNNNNNNNNNNTMPLYYKPMSLRQFLYEGEVAEQLREISASRGFRSPIWATKSSMEKHGYNINDNETGVNINTTVNSITLFNLEQTNAADAIINSSLKEGIINNKKRDNFPFNALGRPLTRRVQEILKKHPSYNQFKSPFWFREEEALAIGTAVKSSQQGCGIIIPHSKFNTVSISSKADAFDIQNEQKQQQEEKNTINERESNSFPDFHMIYNAEQLEDPQKAMEEASYPIECISVNGNRYSVILSIHMRKYCQMYNLRTDPFAIFITMPRLQSLGGEVRMMNNSIPPFTTIFNEELVTLYHVDVTNIPEKINQNAMAARREKMDRIAVSVV